jgi:hypothetical protein
MAAREPGMVGFAHYGVTNDVARVFEQAEERLHDWVEFVVNLDDAADGTEQMRAWVLEGYWAEGLSEEAIDQYDRNTFWPMQVAGIQRWLSQH